MANNIGKFAMLWKVDNDKIFGMLEDLIATKKATSHFFIYAKIG